MKAQQNGMEEEDIVAATFGKESDQLTELEKKYADKLVALMQTKIAQVKKRDAKAKQQILIGKRAYAKGNYSDSIPYFEKACEYTTSDTLVGGEALMWKALALDGSGKLEQAKAIYLDLKEGHPLPSIRNQAGDLLYILEAPKLKIREEERLKIPDLQEVDEFRNRRKTTRTTRPRKTPKPLKKSAPTWEDKFYAKSPVVRAFKNRYVQVAFLVVSTGLSIYGAVYIK